MIDDVVDPGSLTRELIRRRSDGAREDSVLRVVAPILDDAGFEVRIVPWLPERSNLVATWNGGGRLVFCSHADVVPASAAGWATDPYAGVLDGDRLYGRGASDMKGGLAASLAAAIAAAKRGVRGFTFAVTSGEETGSGGARALRAAAAIPEDAFLVIPEPTDNQVAFGHKGATWFSVEARGRAAHASRPELGSNAIERLASVIDEARRWREAQLVDPELGAVTTSVGTISGGTQTNIVPDAATLTLDVRSVPGAEPGSFARRAAALPGVRVETLLDVPAVRTPLDSPLVQHAVEIVAEVSGDSGTPRAMSYFTDAGVLASASTPGAIILGPGAPEQAHAADEWCSIARIDQATEIYTRLLDRWHRHRLTT